MGIGHPGKGPEARRSHICMHEHVTREIGLDLACPRIHRLDPGARVIDFEPPRRCLAPESILPIGLAAQCIPLQRHFLGHHQCCRGAESFDDHGFLAMPLSCWAVPARVKAAGAISCENRTRRFYDKESRGVCGRTPQALIFYQFGRSWTLRYRLRESKQSNSITKGDFI